MSTSPADADSWVDAHADALFRFALTRLRRREDAEDAVQETLLAALTARQAFRGDSAERTWLIGILRHKIVDRIRKSAREDTAPLAEGQDMEDWCGETGHWLHPPKAWQGDPAALADNREFWDQVRKCFADLPERQAQVFALRTFDGASTETICQETGITATNLWVLLHRARTRLRTCLEATWFTPEASP